MFRLHHTRVLPTLWDVKRKVRMPCLQKPDVLLMRSPRMAIRVSITTTGCGTILVPGQRCSTICTRKTTMAAGHGQPAGASGSAPERNGAAYPQRDVSAPWCKTVIAIAIFMSRERISHLPAPVCAERRVGRMGDLAGCQQTCCPQ